jgi:hypothetical protein
MQARSGDWLVVHSHSDGGHVRRAEIVATHGGEPPYTVRWLDEDKESIVFPGPDAQVVSAAELGELDQAAAARIGRVQTAIKGGHVAG